LPYRDGDIVISTRSKHGTTWMQMICALLVFKTPEPPDPLAQLSPWLDWLVEPRADVLARLEAQAHRRFIKTHTPLDGIPLDPKATYIVVARHPLDAAVSLYHQGENLDRERLHQLTGQVGHTAPPDRASLQDWLTDWLDRDANPLEDLDSLPGVMWHLSDAWSRRQEPNVMLVHYQDLSDDLEAVMRSLAFGLGIAVGEDRWPDLVNAATFESMRRRAEWLAPDQLGVLKDPSRFFRQGSSGAGRRHLTNRAFDRYQVRTASLAPADLLEWLHRPERQPGGSRR
jgi:hypothetical protein